MLDWYPATFEQTRLVLVILGGFLIFKIHTWYWVLVLVFKAHFFPGIYILSRVYMYLILPQVPYQMGTGICKGWYCLKSYPIGRFFSSNIDTSTIYPGCTLHTSTPPLAVASVGVLVGFSSSSGSSSKNLTEFQSSWY